VFEDLQSPRKTFDLNWIEVLIGRRLFGSSAQRINGDPDPLRRQGARVRIINRS